MKIENLEKEKYSWLKNSDFYHSIDLEEEEIDVPYCSKYTQDPVVLLEVTNFWGVYSYPLEFFDCMLNTIPRKKLRIKLFDLVEVTKSNFYIFLLKLLEMDEEEKYRNMYDISVEYGILDALTYCHSNNFCHSKEVFSLACEKGHLECLIFLSEHIIHEPYHHNEPLERAVINGHLNCVKYIYNTFFEKDDIFNVYISINKRNLRISKSCYNEILIKAVKYNQLECLKYLYERNFPGVDIVVYAAAKYGRLECLKYLLKNSLNKHQINEPKLFSFAAKSRNLECLIYLYEEECEWNEEACFSAVEYNNIKFLRFLHINGCPYNKWNLLEFSRERCREYILQFM